MIEEVTKENIVNLLSKIPNKTTVIDRILIANQGTVQTLLSVILNDPVDVKVLSQIETDGFIYRWSELSSRGKTVCFANSIIKVKSDNFEIVPGILNGIRDKKFGIGQLLSSFNRNDISTHRELVNAGITDFFIWRIYNIKGIHIDKYGIDITITELFLKNIINNVNKYQYSIVENDSMNDKK